MLSMPRKRELTFGGSPGFPSGIYFGMIDVLEDEMGYEVRKVEDWLEVNPRSDFYDDVVQRKQNVEQQVGRILNNISETRKELEMLRHDKRKLDRIIDHEEEGDLDVLKSDFVDLVDRNTTMSLLELANSGRLPSIVVDFYKVESEEDIEELGVSKGERQILKKKWKLFQDWLNRFVSEIKNRKSMIESEIRSRENSLEGYKKALKPYAKALKRIRLADPEEYKGLDDPRIIERYPASVAGVDLYAWKELSTESLYAEHEEVPPEFEEGMPPDQEGYEFYSFMKIEVRKKTKVVSGDSAEAIKIKIKPSLEHRKDMEEKLEELRKKEEKLLKSIDGMSGDIVDFEEEEEISEGVTGKVKGLGKKLLRIPGEREAHPTHEKVLKDVIEEEVDILYERIKELGDGIRIWKLRK